jgi:hypothetical protein
MIISIPTEGSPPPLLSNWGIISYALIEHLFGDFYANLELALIGDPNLSLYLEPSVHEPQDFILSFAAQSAGMEGRILSSGQRDSNPLF